jgi:hypothetical protein
MNISTLIGKIAKNAGGGGFEQYADNAHLQQTNTTWAQALGFGSHDNTMEPLRMDSGRYSSDVERLSRRPTWQTWRTGSGFETGQRQGQDSCAVTFDKWMDSGNPGLPKLRRHLSV